MYITILFLHIKFWWPAIFELVDLRKPYIPLLKDLKQKNWLNSIWKWELLCQVSPQINFKEGKIIWWTLYVGPLSQNGYGWSYFFAENALCKQLSYIRNVVSEGKFTLHTGQLYECLMHEVWCTKKNNPITRFFSINHDQSWCCLNLFCP